MTIIANDHVAIDVESANRNLAESIQSRIQSHPLSKSCIYRVPEKLRSKAEAEYTPKILAIGPYHRHNPNLKSIEQDKKWYLGAFLDRRRRTIPETSIFLQEVVQLMRGLEKAARECYADSESIRNIESDDFVSMMIFDGCFILELLCRWYDYKVTQRSDGKNNDPLFTNSCMIPRLRRDLLLLENQIPFIVLEKLLNLTSEKYDIHKIIKPFFNGILPASVQDDRAAAPNYGKHLLDLLRSYLILSSYPRECYDEETLQFYDWEPTKCATDISEAGVKFKTSTRYGNYGLFDIKFDNGALEIPPFRFGESVTVLFRNLIALEQCQGHQHLVTSYVFLLHGLLKSPDDVKLLRPSMIVGHLAIDDQTVVNEVKNLCKGVVLNEFYYKFLCYEVNAYCRTNCWRKCKATWERDYLKPLRRDYFNTPWAFVSFAAAVILLLLTTIQTLYSLLSYYLRL